MKKNIAKIWCALLIGIILLIPASYMILKSHINTTNYENRELAKWPNLETTNWYRFPEAIDDFVSDNFPYKNQLVLMNSLANRDVFKDNPSANTIMGKEGFIFYTGETGNSLAQYKGTLKFSDEELEKIADNLNASKKYLEDRNCKFILFIAPNKERMYSEYMPESIKVYDDTCSTDQIIEYLKDNTDINMIWAYNELKRYKETNPDKPIYYHLDTHWNNLGAYIGAKALCDEIDANIPNLEFEETNNSSYDLANYSGLRLVLEGKDIDYEPAGFTDDYEIELDDINGSFIYHNTGKDERRLMICRDSFTIGMRRYIGNTFNESYMPHRNEFETSMVDEFRPDIFVYEVCERDIDKLLNFRLE